jgi:hypothetical protein
MDKSPGEHACTMQLTRVVRVAVFPEIFGPAEAAGRPDEQNSSKLMTRVRFPSPAPSLKSNACADIERAECSLKSAQGNVTGNKRQISSCTWESKTTKPADRRSYPLMRLRWNGEGS